MDQNLQSYQDGMAYETFMKRAFPKKSLSVSYMHSGVIQTLVNAENGKIYFKSLGSFSKQLAAVKDHMRKAFDEYMSMELPVDTKIVLGQMKERLADTATTAGLISIINISNEMTHMLK
ncbi:MAG: hypothetical protein ACOYMF_05250 [Bacteroidales bacterium]